MKLFHKDPEAPDDCKYEEGGSPARQLCKQSTSAGCNKHATDGHHLKWFGVEGLQKGCFPIRNSVLGLGVCHGIGTFGEHKLRGYT